MAGTKRSSEVAQKTSGGRRKCAACPDAEAWRDPSEFSKNQRQKGGLSRCNACVSANKPLRVSSAATEAASNVATTPVSKKPKAAPTQTSKVVTPNDNPLDVELCCQACQNKKKAFYFPRDHEKSSPTCVHCVMDSVKGSCKSCGKEKDRDQFPNFVPHALRAGKAWDKSTIKIKEKIMVPIQRGVVVCLECKASREEKRKQAALEKALRNKQMMDKHNVQFYDFSSVLNSKSPTTIQYCDTKPNNLVGEYDIIFHAGFCAGEHIENRTTKGKVVLKEEPSTHDDGDGNPVMNGKVEFHEELQMNECVFFQQDFELSEGSHGVDRGGTGWQCQLEAKLLDEEACERVHMEDEPASAYLQRIEKRTALPWMKKEWPDGNEEEEKASFDSLEQAEVLAQQHEQGPDCSSSWLIRHFGLTQAVAKRVHCFASNKPKPVLFLEQGDLVLHVEWSDDHRATLSTDCVLRRRSGDGF